MGHSGSGHQLSFQGLQGDYQPRRPEQTVLYQAVARNYRTFEAIAELGEKRIPKHVTEEFEAFLRCGILAHGFLRLKCEDCKSLGRLGEKIRRRVVPEIIHRPGEALILDWGKLRDFIDLETGKKKTVWAFVGTLGFSRFMMVRLVESNDLMTTIDAIESMFREIGGVPERLTSDNPKCFAIEASPYEPLLNPGLELFLSHYKVQMECLPPADPQKKGKVERMMPYVRRIYEAHGKEWP